MEKEKISIIVPVYNVQDYIDRCLTSILNQTYSNLEVIIVDDKSEDDSITIVEKFALSDRRVIIIHHPYNRGLMRARETGYRNAQGAYIFFCDSDDYLPQNAIEVLYNRAQQDEFEIVSGSIYCVDDSGSKSLFCDPVLPYGNDSSGVLKAVLNHLFPHNICGKLFKTSVFTDHQYLTYDNFINAEDVCLFYQIIPFIKKVGIVNSPSYYYYNNFKSSSKKRISSRGLETIIIANRIRYQLIPLFPELKRDICATIIELVSGVSYHYGKKSIYGYLVNNKLDHLFKFKAMIAFCGLKQGIISCIKYNFR